MRGTGLNPKQAAFVREYLVDLNKTQAATRAGFAHPEVQGSRLFGNVRVRAAIDAALAKRAAKLEVSTDRTLRELARLAFADLGEAFDSEGRLLPMGKMPEDIRRALSGVEVEQLFDGAGPERYHAGDTVKVKGWDKVGALKLLMQHQGMLVERHEHALVSLEQLVGGIAPKAVDE